MSSESQVTAGAKSEQVKAYLESTVVPVLTQALTQMCISEPDDPFSWLAQVIIISVPCLNAYSAPTFLFLRFISAAHESEQSRRVGTVDGAHALEVLCDSMAE